MNRAWEILKENARHHPSIEDCSLFFEMMRNIIEGKNLHVARYNDGEWVFMLKIEPYYSRLMAANKHNRKEVESFSAKLMSIIDSIPQYYIGVDSTTRALKEFISLKKKEFKSKIDVLPNLIYGDIFNAATVLHGIKSLTDPLKKRAIITVGPDYIKKLEISAHHVVTPINNCWVKHQDVEKELDSIISKLLPDNPVVLYSCSLLAKYLVDRYYHMYGDRLSGLDIGSCLDPWCGISSRPWHDPIIEDILINDFDETSYLEKNSDVKNAVRRGIFKSGLSHYLLYGRKEKRYLPLKPNSVLALPMAKVL